MTHGKASAARAKAAERREMAWELRKHGYSYRKIAEALRQRPGVPASYSKSQAERDIRTVLEELQERTIEEAAEARTLAMARLDDMLAAWFRNASRRDGPDKEAAKVVLQVIEQQAKLMGLYRQELALITPAPLAVATADFSRMTEEELRAVIRNMDVALAAGQEGGA